MNINYITKVAMQSLRYNHHVVELKGVTDVNDLKRKWLKLYHGDEKPSIGFINGAKQIDFNVIYQFIKQS